VIDDLGNSMFELDPKQAERVEQLESEIDELREAVRRSHRLALVGRICAVLGPALLLGLLLGALDFTPVRMIVGISLALGGIVLMGSSKTSTEHLEQSLKRTQVERNTAMGALEFIQTRAGPPPQPGV
jgi:hypothetical protein